MIGVVTSPPSAPSEVIVIVLPDSSSRPALPVRAASLTRAISAAAAHTSSVVGVADDGDEQPVRRLRGDADVDRTVDGEELGLVVERRVEVRLVGDGEDDRPHQERQQGQARRVGMGVVQRAAQLVDRADVDLVDVGDVRDARRGERHPVGDPPAQPDDRPLLGRTARRRAGVGPTGAVAPAR